LYMPVWHYLADGWRSQTLSGVVVASPVYRSLARRLHLCCVVATVEEIILNVFQARLCVHSTSTSVYHRQRDGHTDGRPIVA